MDKQAGFSTGDLDVWGDRLGAGEIILWVNGACASSLATQVQSPELTQRWKRELTSDLTHSLWHVHTHTRACAHIDTHKYCKKKIMV